MTFLKAKKIVFALMGITFSFLIGILLIEISLTAYYKLKYNSTVDDYKKGIHFNEVLGQDPSECSWMETLYPHYLTGWVYKDETLGCGTKTSNLNLNGQDLPWEKKDEFVILVLGGSVSEHLSGGSTPHKINWLEKKLNELYEGPSGKRIKVVTGSMGGWKQPIQLTMLSTHIQRIDAFISVEGYNEIRTLQRESLEMPFDAFFYLASVPDANNEKLVRLMKFQKQIKANKVLDQSFFINVVFNKLVQIVKEKYLTEVRQSLIKRKSATPKNWTEEQRIDFEINKYISYVRSMDGISLANKKPGMIFLQPIPNLYKPLTEYEKKIKHEAKPENYLKIEKMLEENRFHSMKFASLKKIYEKEGGEIYWDDIHGVSAPDGKSHAYELMAKEIAHRFAAYMKLSRKIWKPF